MSSLYSGKQQLYDKLEKMLNSNTDETEISFLIDSLRVILLKFYILKPSP